ncbi:transmembrane protein 54-like isoform 2-T2 [Aulostomus maculatus]
MAGAGLCCASLEDSKTLMKMGLSLVLLGHVNFLLGALVHGVVLRHINLHKQARAMEYAISNVVALASGLVMWSVFSFSLAAALMAAASALGLFVSVVRAIIHGGRSLLTHCRFPDAIGYSSITNECPFDPTRIYSTTLILWVPLIVTCVIQLVFSARCVSLCISFLGLPCWPHRRKPAEIRVVRPIEEAAPSLSTNPRRYNEPSARYFEAPRSSDDSRRHNTEPRRQQHRSPPLHQHRSLPPSERRPLRQPYRERSDCERLQTRVGSQQRPPEQHRLLERGALERSSFWI